MLENIDKGFTQEQLDAILDVFTTEGWKIIQHDMKIYQKQLDSVRNLESVEDLYKLKGELSSLEWFINLKEWYQAAEAYEKDI